MSSIFSTNTVQAPAVYIDIMGVQLGLADFAQMKVLDISSTIFERPATPKSLTTYPNLITKLEVKKIVNAQANVYDLELKYVPNDNEDPSYIDKLISANRYQNNSKISIAYGDSSTDGFFRKKDEAMLTTYTMNMDIESGCMTYSIKAITNSAACSATSPEMGGLAVHEFPDESDMQVSMVIKKIWSDPKYGYKTLFPGGIYIDGIYIDELRSDNAPDIAREGSLGIDRQDTSLGYLIYLVSILIHKSEGTTTDPTMYVYAFNDSKDEQSFNIFRAAGASNGVAVVDEINIGIRDSVVLSYAFTKDFTYGITVGYGFNNSPNSRLKYYLDADGNEVAVDTVAGKHYSLDRLAMIREESWWKSMASISMGLSLTTRGVTRQLPLMSKLKVNIFVKSQLHYSSGIYYIVETYDKIDMNGYVSQFKLVKESSDMEVTNLTAEDEQLIKELYGSK